MPRAAAPSLAVVLSGQVRTFVSPKVYQHFRSKVLHALCPTSDACAIELFLCSSLGKSGCSSMAERNSFRTQVTTSEFRTAVHALNQRSAIDALYRRSTIHIAHVDWEQPTSCDDSLRCGMAERRWCSGPRRSCASSVIHPAIAAWNASISAISRNRRNPRLFEDEDGPLASIVGVRTVRFPASRLGVLRWLRCLQHLHSREALRSTPFDWVLVARFDNGYFAPLPPLSAFTSQHGVHLPANHYSPLNDFFALMPRDYAEAYLSTASQACCTSCWLRSPPLPWDMRTIDRSNRSKSAGILLDVIPHGPEQWLAAQLFVHGVPVYGGFFPIVLTRTRASSTRAGQHHDGACQGRSCALTGECFRHRVCNTTSASYSQTAVSDLHPPQDSEAWPPCPSDRVARCERFFQAVQVK
jgi:hypothetical protein